ncbi:integrase catalytic domain-containing protein [Trichonephila clavata]|uniref:Integrase catalytic domain-containing protein n=1 Tax=Trichonephila clavata TaxID=2740835 RepID=A0A8X6L663_TRICU|nr:integrase catalytic domain-containing protein [Trichonephila clavata]
MRDDSSAEKKILAAVCPEANQLLFYFHVAQDEWCWLFSYKMMLQKEKIYIHETFASSKTRWKQFVANRVNEITSLTDPQSWYRCAAKENPADFLCRGLSADSLVTNSRWWTGAEFLTDPDFSKNLKQVVPELDYLTEPGKKTVVQERKKMPEAESSIETVLLNNDSSTIFGELLELSNSYFKVINVLSYIFRFIYNCKNNSKKVCPLTVAEFKESEIKLIKHAQRPLFDKKEIPSRILEVYHGSDGKVRVVKVLTKSGEIKRAIKIAVLRIDIK